MKTARHRHRWIDERAETWDGRVRYARFDAAGNVIAGNPIITITITTRCRTCGAVQKPTMGCGTGRYLMEELGYELRFGKS